MSTVTNGYQSDVGRIKIGKTSRCGWARYNLLKIGSAIPLVLVGEASEYTEAQLHDRFASQRVRDPRMGSEWFNIDLRIQRWLWQQFRYRAWLHATDTVQRGSRMCRSGLWLSETIMEDHHGGPQE